MRILQSSRRVDLLISDIGLPGSMDGQHLAQAGRRVRPGLKVLFITGYAGNTIIGEDGALGDDMRLMKKPFTMEALADTVATMTDGS
jgi:DNA-binding NtrC family response regulator